MLPKMTVFAIAHRLSFCPGNNPMRPCLDSRLIRRILPLFVCCISVATADESPVLNELNSTVEEPLIYLPEAGAGSPFRSVSRPRAVTSISDDAALIKLAEDAVDSTRRRLLSVEANSPWQIMHGLLALRHNFEIKKDGKIISGMDWVASGPRFEGEPWFERTRHGGRAHPYSRPWAFEGHANQFLAVLSMSALPVDHEFQTPTGPITIADMVKHAQKTVSTKDEPTWTLWALSRYLPPNAEWRNVQGEPWSVERLVEIQTAKPLKGSACGGSHGLFAIAHARNIYLRTGKPLRGPWLEAEYKIRRHINIARVQQNGNGMLSSNYFRGREYKQDFNKRMASAGHILEFLMIALPQDELKEVWVRRAIRATSEDLLRNRKAFVKCSPLYHAVNALNIYLDRVRPAAGKVALKGMKPELKTVDANSAGELKSISATNISNSREETEQKSSDVPPVPDGNGFGTVKTKVSDAEDAANEESEESESAGDAEPANKVSDEPAADWGILVIPRATDSADTESDTATEESND